MTGEGSCGSSLTSGLSCAAFAEYEPDEQRQALRLMAHAQNPPKEEFVLAANRAALGHPKKLAETLAVQLFDLPGFAFPLTSARFSPPPPKSWHGRGTSRGA